MRRNAVRAGLTVLLMFPQWTGVHALDVPLPRIELVPHAEQTEPAAGTLREKAADEAEGDKAAPHLGLPFQYDVMPADEEREERPAPQPETLDVRRA